MSARERLDRCEDACNRINFDHVEAHGMADLAEAVYHLRIAVRIIDNEVSDILPVLQQGLERLEHKISILKISTD